MQNSLLLITSRITPR